MNLSDIVISVLIIALLIWAVWRGGSSNPVGTGKLQREVSNIKGRMQGLEDTMKTVPTERDLGLFRGEVQTRMGVIEEKLEHCASSAEVSSIKKSIEHVCKQNDTLEATMLRQDKSQTDALSRIEGFLLSSSLVSNKPRR